MASAKAMKNPSFIVLSVVIFLIMPNFCYAEKYRNEDYSFEITESAGFICRTAPPEADHGITILVGAEDCSAIPSIKIAIWGSYSADPEIMTQRDMALAWCDAFLKQNSDLRFGDLQMFECEDETREGRKLLLAGTLRMQQDLSKFKWIEYGAFIEAPIEEWENSKALAKKILASIVLLKLD